MIDPSPQPRAFALPIALALAFLFFLRPTSAEYTSTNTSGLHDNLRNCSCYVVDSGSASSQYFQFHRFFDFRNLATKAGQYVNAPPILNATYGTGNASTYPVWDSEVLDSSAWNQDWLIQNWSQPSSDDFPITMYNSPGNVYLGQSNESNSMLTWLTLRTSRLEDEQTSGEIENLQKNVKHCSMRMYGRVLGAKGAVAGFFTYFDDNNESDIEILTNDPTDQIRYTNQPSVDKHGDNIAKSSLAPSDLAPWNEWQTHRIDWLSKQSVWFVNNNQVAQNTYGLPKKSSGLVMNMWSDGGTWSGNMSVGDVAEFQIQWIEMVFNTSGPVQGPPGARAKRWLGEEEEEHEEEKEHVARNLEEYDGTPRHLEKRKSKGCEIVCKIDDVKELGTPEIVSVNMSLASGISASWGLLALVAAVSIFVGI